MQHCLRNLPMGEEASVAWAQQNGLLRRTRLCPRHRQVMRLEQPVEGHQGRFRCTRGRGRSVVCSDIPLRQGSWFENTNLKLHDVIGLMYAFAHDWGYAQIKHELRDVSLPLNQQTQLSPSTTAAWLAYYREMMTDDFHRLQMKVGPLGGPGIVVRIDESKFGKRKYARGRVIEGHWVLGMIEEESDKARMFVVERRDADTLLPLIQQNVLPGSIIHTDMWAAYRSLENLGFTHRTVNRSDRDHPFVNPNTGTHTQRIEATWKPAKVWFRGDRVSSEAFGHHLIEYLWRRNVRLNSLDPMETILEAIRFEYGDLRL